MKIEDLDTPVLLVAGDAFGRNVARMAKLCADAGIACRPHAKAHKSPQVARIQMEAGAVGMCCAKLGEAEVMAAAGIEDLHITTPVVGASKIMRLIEAARQSRISVVADDRGQHLGPRRRARRRPASGSTCWWRSTWGRAAAACRPAPAPPSSRGSSTAMPGSISAASRPIRA